MVTLNSELVKYYSKQSMGKSLTDKPHGSGLSHLTRKQEPHYRLPTVSQVHSCESTLVSAVGIGQ